MSGGTADKQREQERRLRRAAHARGQDYATYLANRLRRAKLAAGRAS
jgi:hypothetical protein